MSSTQQRFCEQCGTALGPNARFCGKCGQPVAATAPTGRGEVAALTSGSAPAGRGEAASSAQAQACTMAQNLPQRKKKGSIWGRLLLIIVGLALVILGLRGPVLGAIGESATAVITDVSVSDSEEHEYQVTYRFTVDGKAYTGSWSQEALNITTLPREGATIGVRYLPQWPAMNVPARDAMPSTGNLLLSALGLALILFNGKFRIG